jgi:hypothetical protein
MDARLRQLLDLIVRERTEPMEEKAAELSNPAADDSAAATEARAEARARDLDDAFETGLKAARRASGELRLDASDPLQDRLADALIQFLVRPGLATVRTEELAQDQFVYYVSVDWAALRRLALQAGINLDEALGTSDE